MAEIIEKGGVVEVEAFSLLFTYTDDPSAGFSFDCDRHGNVDTSEMSELGIENLNACLAGTNSTVADGIVDRSYSYRAPTVIRCQCRRGEVALDGFTNTCDRCGRDYNMSGQVLAPRSQWGEETGESLSDIFNPYDRDEVGHGLGDFDGGDF